MKEGSVFYITAGSEEEANKVATALVKNNLAACVNVIPKISSYFYWEGEVQAEEEILMIGKTRSELVDELVEKVREVHSYELPCVITWEIDGGNQDFINWIIDETRG